MVAKKSLEGEGTVFSSPPQMHPETAGEMMKYGHVRKKDLVGKRFSEVSVMAK